MILYYDINLNTYYTIDKKNKIIFYGKNMGKALNKNPDISTLAFDAYDFVIGKDSNRWINMLQKVIKKPAYLFFLFRATFPSVFHRQLGKVDTTTLKKILDKS